MQVAQNVPSILSRRKKKRFFVFNLVMFFVRGVLKESGESLNLWRNRKLHSNRQTFYLQDGAEKTSKHAFTRIKQKFHGLSFYKSLLTCFTRSKLILYSKILTGFSQTGTIF